MKKNIKHLFPLFLFLCIIIFFKWFSTGFIIQEHLNTHPNIGKEIHFKQPISYIKREVPAIVPIVAEIGKEIEQLHIKLNSEKENEYIPSSTTFIIEDAYAYRDIVNKRTIYFILSDQKEKYILSEEILNKLQKPIYPNAQMPTQILDKLYKNKLENTIKIQFYLTKRKGRYYDLFNINTFKTCDIRDVITKENNITATVNFNQLSCLYSKLWDSQYSAEYPVKFEVIE